MTAALTTLAALFACFAVGLSLRNFLRSELESESTSQPAAPQSSAMRPRLLSECNPELLRQMPPRTRKRWRIFRCPRRLFVALLLLASPVYARPEVPKCPEGSYPSAITMEGAITGYYCQAFATSAKEPAKDEPTVPVVQGLFGCSAVPGANHGDRYNPRYEPQTLTAPRDPPAPHEATSLGVQHRYGGWSDVGATPPDRLAPKQAAQPALPWKPAAVALLLLLVGWYARMRWWGGVLRVRNAEIFVWPIDGWWVRRVLTYRSDHPTVRVHYQDFDHNTLPGAIWAASVDGHHARRQPYCIWERHGDRCGQGGHVCTPRTLRGRILGRTCQWWQRSLGRLGFWCPWHRSALRGLPVLLLLLCSTTHAASTRPDDPPLTPVRCPAGQVLVGGRCVPQKPVRHQGRGWCLLTLDPGRDVGDETDPDEVEAC